MRFDPAKSFPHPVLREGSSDYEGVEFQVEIELHRTETTTAVALKATFDLSDEDLCKLVEEKKAEYALLLVSPRTRVRTELRSNSNKLTKTFEHGELGGEIELRPFLLATDNLTDFRAKCWHQDYEGQNFEIKRGAVLASDTPFRSFVDTEDEGSIGSIFQTSVGQQEEGTWSVALDDDRIRILLAKSDFDTFRIARARANSDSDWAYLMNGLYLTFLIYVLTEADRNDAEQIYESRRWYASLQARLEEIDAPSLGSSSSGDRLLDAQRLLNFPFSRLLLRLSREDDE